MISEYDVLIRSGTLYDGSGAPPVVGEVAVQGDTLAAVGPLPGARGRLEIDARGLAVAPGFVNMLSWANTSLLEDGRSQSDLRQGVTLEVLGEGSSMGPLNDRMKADLRDRQGDVKYEIAWTTLGEYLDHLAARGVAPNIASFVGSATLRVHELGYEDRPPTAAELERMQARVRQAMAEGALGVSAALIYVPNCFASTEELIALARAAGEAGGLYIAHLRSEGDRLLEAVDEHLRIARGAGVRAEIYHLKAVGRANWPKIEVVIQAIEAARAEGLAVTADMYPYTAAATGLDATVPPWVQAGEHHAWLQRLRDPGVRARVVAEMKQPSPDWENFYHLAGAPENIVFTSFRTEALKPLAGRSLAQVAAERGRPPEEVILDLMLEDDSNIGAAFHLMSEANVRRQIALPWVSFGSDGQSLAAEGVFLRSSPHPRAYGTFARLLGRYVREERLVPLEEAVRRLTAFPADNLRLARRGRLRVGHYADVVVFDPQAVQDHATFARPHQYAAGVRHVLVNGVPALQDGELTGRLPGRVVRGPGWRLPR